MERHAFSSIRKINIVKMLILPKLIYRFNTIQIKTPADFFAEIDKLMTKFMPKNLEKEE